MATPGRTPDETVSTADKILDAAAKLFAERGIENVSVAEIVRAAGQRNASAVNYHFGNRNDLLHAVLASRGESGTAAVFPRLSPQETARQETEGTAPKRATWREHVAAGRAGLDGWFTQAGLLAFAQDQAALDARIREHLA